MIIENSILYKDFNFTKEWTEILGSYEIQIIGEKARIKCYSVFGKPQQSRLNKLRQIGSVGDVKLYHLIVNGLNVYFKK
jgi:hypothetical protein